MSSHPSQFRRGTCAASSHRDESARFNDASFIGLEQLEARLLLSATVTESGGFVFHSTAAAIEALPTLPRGGKTSVVIDLGTADGESSGGSVDAAGQINRRLGKVAYDFSVVSDGQFTIGVSPDSGKINFAVFDADGRKLVGGRAAGGDAEFLTGYLEEGDYELRLLRRRGGLTDYEVMIAAEQAPSLTSSTTESVEPLVTATLKAGDSSSTNIESSAVAELVLPENPIFDLIRFKDEPDFANDYGFLPISKVGSAQLWLKGEDRSEPNIEQIKRVAASMGSNQPIVIEIEHWPTNQSSSQNKASIDKLVQVARAFRQGNPGAKIGFYRMLPVRNWFTSVRHDRGHPEYERWRDQNRALKKVAREVDFIFPSLYTFKPDFNEDGSPYPGVYADYREYVLENIQEAKQYFHKPIYAFISPYYPPGSRYFNGQEISGEYWKRILRVVGDKADGFVIWTAHAGINTPWNPDSEWWRETVKYLESR